MSIASYWCIVFWGLQLKLTCLSWRAASSQCCSRNATSSSNTVLLQLAYNADACTRTVYTAFWSSWCLIYQCTSAAMVMIVEVWDLTCCLQHARWAEQDRACCFLTVTVRQISKHHGSRISHHRTMHPISSQYMWVRTNMFDLILMHCPMMVDAWPMAFGYLPDFDSQDTGSSRVSNYHPGTCCFTTRTSVAWWSRWWNSRHEQLIGLP